MKGGGTFPNKYKEMKNILVDKNNLINFFLRIKRIRAINCDYLPGLDLAISTVSTKFKNNELAHELVKVPIEW